MNARSRAALQQACTEAEFHAYVVELFTLFGWLIFHDYDPRRNNPGFPDLCMVHPSSGHVLFIELKRQNGKLRPAQIVWKEALEKHYESTGRSGHRHFVWRPADQPLIERIARGR